jgi:hypothetical protein
MESARNLMATINAAKPPRPAPKPRKPKVRPGRSVALARRRTGGAQLSWL